jgi:hypothetical protein
VKKLPSSLEALLRSKNFLKVGRQIASDFQKLARDFPGLKLPKKRKKGFIGTLDIGQLAAKKNVVPQATASLQAIVAAALGAYLLKEHRVSSWSTPNYSDLEKDYAALDAHVLLMLVENLQTSRADGQPLSSLTPVGQPVSLYICNHEVAHGTIVAQPAFFESPGGPKIGGSGPHTRCAGILDYFIQFDSHASCTPCRLRILVEVTRHAGECRIGQTSRKWVENRCKFKKKKLYTFFYKRTRWCQYQWHHSMCYFPSEPSWEDQELGKSQSQTRQHLGSSLGMLQSQVQ